MSGELRGILPVLQTPFDARDEISESELQREIDWVFEVGANGVCAAMVSEVLRLTASERNRLNQLIVEMTNGRGQVVASVGAESLPQALEYAREAQDAGCSALMAIPPVATALPEDALWEYFSTIAEQIELPLIVQDASAYVGGGMSVPFYIRLLDKFGPEKILFKPEGSPVGPTISQLRDASRAQARIFDGSGGILLVDAYRRGVLGTMPGVDLLDGIVKLWQALERGDDETAYRLSFPISALVALQLQAGLDGFLAIEKYLLVKRGIFDSDRRRKPNAWSLDADTRLEVDRLFEILMLVLNSLE